MKNLSVRARIALLSVITVLGLALMLALSMAHLASTVRKDIGERTQRTVEAAQTVLVHFHALETSGQMTRPQAQAAALGVLRTMRYGKDDYFWVNDMGPTMLMHPFKPELEGKDLSAQTDPDGVRIFQLMTQTVRDHGEGFVHYRWTKPHETTPSPKISYVKGFAPWGWIVGSGAYVDDIQAATWQALLSQGSIALLAIMAMAGFTFLLSRSIAVPIHALAGRMRSLAGGDTTAPIPGLDRGDEIGAMSQALEAFRDAVAGKASADAERARAEADQRFVVDVVSRELANLSEGDLTAEIREEFPPSYVAISTNFNAALANLRALLAAVATSAAEIRTGSGEIAEASASVAQETERTAQSLQQTAGALDQMEGRLRSTAVAAGRTAEQTNEAISIVGAGRSTADEAVSAMNRVSESAQGIDSVIEGLDKIAFQTRVLAMNAAVEAGRAGEAGRGFAVVADLVSALAMRSEEEAKRAREQLTATRSDIGTAVEAVRNVDGALAGISESVAQVHQLVGTMADDNQAQSATITDITAAMRRMDQSVQQNAAKVEETSAAAQNLAVEVTSLAEQAARFRVERRKYPRAAAGAATLH